MSATSVVGDRNRAIQMLKLLEDRFSNKRLTVQEAIVNRRLVSRIRAAHNLPVEQPQAESQEVQ